MNRSITRRRRRRRPHLTIAEPSKPTVETWTLEWQRRTTRKQSGTGLRTAAENPAEQPRQQPSSSPTSHQTSHGWQRDAAYALKILAESLPPLFPLLAEEGDFVDVRASFRMGSDVSGGRRTPARTTRRVTSSFVDHRNIPTSLTTSQRIAIHAINSRPPNA